jgi:hypothetical protein
MRLIEGHFYGEVHAIDMRVEPLQKQLEQLVEAPRRCELDLARRLARSRGRTRGATRVVGGPG